MVDARHSRRLTIITSQLPVEDWHQPVGEGTVDEAILDRRFRLRLPPCSPKRVGAPHVRHLTGPLWEIRLSGRDGIARALHVVASGRRVVVVRAYVKKTRRTPRRENEVALRRAKEETQ